MRPTTDFSRRVFLVCLTAVLALCAGCGGGGGGTPDLAPANVTSRTLVVADPNLPGVSTTFVFAATAYTSPGGDSGTYTYAKIPNTTTQATLAVNSSFQPARSYTLTFTSAGGGTYVDQLAHSSTFTIQ